MKRKPFRIFLPGHFLFLDITIPHSLAKVNSFSNKIVHIFCAIFLFIFNIDIFHKIKYNKNVGSASEEYVIKPAEPAYT